MDFYDLGTVRACEKPTEMELYGPGEVGKTDIVFEVLGFDAEVVVAAGRAFDRAEARRTDADREGDTESTFDRRMIALCKAAVVGWRNMLFKGEPLEFTAEAWAKLADDPNYRFAVRQVYSKGSSLNNFFPKASTA